MEAKFRASKIRNSIKLISPLIWVFADHDQEQQIVRNKSQKSFNVNDEYLCTLRTKSNIEFFTTIAQSIVHESPPSTSSSSSTDRRRRKFSEAILLQPAAPSVLESPFLLMLPELKGLLIDYLNVSAKASNLCTHLLANVRFTRSNLPETIESIASDLRSPFSDLDKRDLALIHDEYAAVSYRLNSTRKKVARQIRSMKTIDRITCGLITIAGRTLTALDPDPALSCCFRLMLVTNGGLEKVGEQLEAAAKGSYIVNREIETMSRLVVRLSDAVDHGKAMMRLFVERKEEKFAVAVAMDEVKKNNLSIGKQVEDVEEHLYLCIVTIDRTRAPVIDQM